MANTIIQNSQRGLIFITWIITVIFFIFMVIRVAKKLLDNTV